MCGRISQSYSGVLGHKIPGNFTENSYYQGPLSFSEDLAAPFDRAAGESIYCITSTRTLPSDLDTVMTSTALRWGLPLNDQLILNMRIESAHINPTWRESFRFRRAVTYMRAWYEGPNKITSSNLTLPLYAAGLIVTAPDANDRFVMLTQPSVSNVKPIHNRMPYVLFGGYLHAWLNYIDVKNYPNHPSFSGMEMYYNEWAVSQPTSSVIFDITIQ